MYTTRVSRHIGKGTLFRSLSARFLPRALDAEVTGLLSFSSTTRVNDDRMVNKMLESARAAGSQKADSPWEVEAARKALWILLGQIAFRNSPRVPIAQHLAQGNSFPKFLSRCPRWCNGSTIDLNLSV